MRDHPQAIAVIGLSCRFPGAQNARELWENILTRRRQFRRIPECRLPLSEYYDLRASDKTYATRAAVLDLLKFDWAAHRIPKSSYEGTDWVHWLAYQVAIEAVSDAGYSKDSIPRRKTGVILGNTLCGEQTRTLGIRLRWPFIARALEEAGRRTGMTARATRRLLTDAEAVLKSVFPMLTEDSLAGAMSNTIAGRVCSVFDLDGGGYVVDGACASSLLATSLAADKLAAGDLDLAIAGGVDVSIDPLEMVGYAGVGALTRDDVTVYGRRSTGFLLGEGCGMVVLKRLEDARRDGNTIYAVLRGWGMSASTQAPARKAFGAPSARGVQEAILRAHDAAGYSPADLDFIEGYGSGLPDTDRAELEGVFAAMRERPPSGAPRGCGMTAIKPLIGHTKGAAGVASLIKAVIALNRRVLPPTAGLSLPDQLFLATTGWLYPLGDGEALPADAPVRAGVTALGISGINCHITMESHDAPAERLAPTLEERLLLASFQETEVFLFAADDLAGLDACLAAAVADAETATEAELTDLSAQLARAAAERAPGCRAAIVAHSTEGLVAAIGRAREAISAAGAGPLTWTSLDRRIWIRSSPSARTVGFAFPDARAATLGSAWTLVQRHGWARQLVAVAEARLGVPLADALDLPRARVDPEERAARAAALAAPERSGPAAVLSSLLWVGFLERIGLGPTVVSGHGTGALAALAAAGQLDPLEAIALAARTPEDPETDEGSTFDPTFGSTAESEAAIAVIDAEGRLISDATDVVDRWRAFEIADEEDAEPMLRALAERADLILEVGPGRDLSLAALERLGRDGVPCLPVESRPANDRDLNAVVAALFAHGHDLGWSALFEGRLVRPFVPARERTFFRNPCERPFPAPQQRDRPPPAPPAILEAPWATALGLTPEQLQAHLDRHGTTLTEAIRADLAALAADGRLELPPTFIAEAEPVLEADAAAGEVTAGAADGEQAPASGTPDADIEAAIIALVIEKTGYPEESISLESRLLDDLNLDSIKAAEVVGTTAQRFGADGQIDASMFANASIREIAGAIRMIRMNESVDVGQMEGGARIMKPHELSDPPWVRNFEAGVLVAAPLPADVSGADREEEDWTSAVVLILADREETDPHARALAQALSGLGATVSIWPYTAEGALERGRFSHTFAILSPRPTGAEEAAAASPADAALGADPLARMVRRLHAAAAVSSGPNRFPRQRVNALTFVQFGGGTFTGVPALEPKEDTGVVSFAASVHLERPRQRVKVVDLAPELSPEQAAAAVIREVEASGHWAAAGYDAELVRRERRARLQDPAAYVPRPISWSAADVVLATGGARGITAECALSFARATGVKLALVGSTPFKPQDEHPTHQEIARTLARAREEGISAAYFACDVTDLAAVREVIAAAEAELGPITGVIHGAGFNHPKPAEQLSEAEALGQLRPKVLGTVNLIKALAARPLKIFSALTSIIGVAGIQGNSWYALANELTDLLLRAFSAETGVPALAAAYGIWSEVGMGARLGAVAMVEKIGTAAIPPAEGARRFVQLMLGDPGCRQVVVTARLGGLDTWQTDPLIHRPKASRFLDQIMRAEAGVDLVVRTHLDLERDPYLRDHTWAGSPIFPAVFGIEAMAQVAAMVTQRPDLGAGSLLLESVRLDRPVLVHPDYGAEIQISALVEERAPEPSGAGKGGPMRGPVRVITRITTRQLAFRSDCFSAVFVLDPSPLEAGAPPPAEPAIDGHLHPEDFYGSHLFHGPAFQRITDIEEVSRDRVRFRAEFDEDVACAAASQGALLIRDPFFLDTLLHGMALGRLESVALPTRIERVRFDFGARPPRGRVEVRALVADAGEDEYRGDALARDKDGRAFVALEGVTLRAVEHRGESTAAVEAPAPVPDPAPAAAAKGAEAPEPRAEPHAPAASAPAGSGGEPPACEAIAAVHEIGLANADPAARVRAALSHAATALGVGVPPAVDAVRTPGIHRQRRAERRERATPLLGRVASAWREASGQPQTDGTAAIRWAPNGKPQIAGDAGDISLSHDDDLCLAVAGPAPQGCDLVLVEDRRLEDWVRMLGNGRRALLEELEAHEPAEIGGARIWAALEATRKTGREADEMRVVDRRGQAVLIETRARGSTSPLRVLTTPVRIAPDERARVIAVVVGGEP